MPTILQLRRGTTAENAAYTGAAGEITVDTTLNKILLRVKLQRTKTTFSIYS